MNKIKVLLNYQLGEESEDLNFDTLDGQGLGEMMGQESISEFMNNLDELEKKAKILLIDESGKIIKSKLVKIEF